MITTAEHVATLRRSARSLIRDAAALSMGDRVPTCPEWNVADLVGHAGGVASWAATIVAESRSVNLPEDEIAALFEAPRQKDALLEWYAAAVTRLAAALQDPANKPGVVFLMDPPEPLAFWARRQAHEATIHRVDALSATLGHLPTSAQAGVDLPLALDGIDELLTGFVPRQTSHLHTDEPTVVRVAPTDAEARWTVSVGTGPPVTVRDAAAAADVVLTGSASALYLGLWNRGDEIAEHGSGPVLGLWRDKVRVRWR